MPAALDPFAIDLDAARRHLAALDDAEAPFIFAAFPERSGADGRPRQFLRRLREAAPLLVRAQRDGYGVFVTVNAMRGARRRAIDVARVRAVWAERDQPGLDLSLRPSLIVATSPGRRHDYWLVDAREPLAPLDARRINRQIAVRCGADAAATDLARVLRLAGSLNLKGPPFRVHIEAIEQRCYRAREILEAVPPPPQRAKRRTLRVASLDRNGPADIDAIVGDLARALPGTRNSTLNRAAFRLALRGLDIEQISALLTPAALSIGLEPREIIATIRSAGTAGQRESGDAEAGSTDLLSDRQE